VLRIAGLLETNAGRYERAKTFHRRAIELEPESGEGHRRLGEAYEANDEIDKALAEFQRAVELEPSYFKVHRSLGAFYFQRANYARAVVPLSKAAELAPSEPNVHFALGAAYLNSGQFSPAEQQLRIAIGLRETFSALHALGLVLMYQNQDRDAIPYFNRALEVSPDSFWSLMYLGIASRRVHNEAESIQANQRGLTLAEVEVNRNPNNGYYRSFLGYFSAALKNRRRAEAEIAQALRQLPNDADTRWTAVLAYEALGSRDAALVLLNAAPREQLEDLNRWPDLAGLHQDPRFITLLASHSNK